MKKFFAFGLLILVSALTLTGCPAQQCEHTQTAIVAVIAPTCVNEGYTINDCVDCGYVFHDTIVPADGESHFFELIEEVGATCTEEGLQTYKCSLCEEIKTETTEVAEHNFGEWSVVEETTCSHLGYEKRNCLDCGYEEHQEHTELLEHTWGEPEVVESTCTKAGYEKRICSACGEKKVDELAILDHTYGDVLTKEPTCTENGTVHEICSECDELHILEFIPAHGHTFGEWFVEQDQTCTEKGEERRECSECDHYESRPIDEHFYVDTVKDSTCTSVGYTEHRCEKCDHVYITDCVFANGHKFGDWYDVPDIEGLERRDCECGHYEVRAEE